ncbi:putative spermidine/putrescine transport system permease protein [Ruminiclostridium sufflavum DSM 19573]|uniref:Putative spermidine/putrescine transport system permease protein n=1 Tax=Ruminiclostridium sufflavum DSM 19573 TaxID=1121337 RepID=A0A318XP79_9FIRM|nr:ABC transporter permease [Ruminiclostridium sufflavum]PYG88740.1 putative spermidine/putrescine transport system permease protein [Ruminiclostridium sufflavum DSM 19573]
MIWVIAILIILFLVLPVLIIIPMSFSSSRYIEFPPPGFSAQWYEKFFGSQQWTDSLVTSIQVGIITTVIALLLGILAAEGIHKSDFKGKGILTELFMMPMLVPAIIVGLALYRFEAQNNITGTFAGIVIAHTLLAVPFVIRTVLASLSGLNPNYELAAQNLGANKFKAFIKVTFPIIKPAVFSGGMFAFATSFDEIVVTQFISGIRLATLPKRMWDGLRQQIDPTITAIAAIMIIGITLIMIIANSKEIFSRTYHVKEEVLDETD